MDSAGHDFFFPGNDGKGIAAGDCLSKGCKIRSNPVVLLRAAGCHMKAGDHLVKNEQAAIFFCQGSDVFEIILCRQDRPGIAHKGLHDDGGNFVALFLQ